MERHIRLLGVLFVVWGAVSIVFGLIIFSLFALGAFFLDGRDDALALTVIGTIIGSFSLLTGIPEIVAGWGLIKHKQWSRIVTLIMAVFNVISPPLGTALGVYAFWVLFNPASKPILTE